MGGRFLAGVVLLLSVWATPAQSQIMCLDRSILVKRLKMQHKERQRALGLSAGMVGRKHLFELWLSKGGSFTILRVTPKMMACIVGSGTDWEFDVEPREFH